MKDFYSLHIGSVNSGHVNEQNDEFFLLFTSFIRMLFHYEKIIPKLFVSKQYADLLKKDGKEYVDYILFLDEEMVLATNSLFSFLDIVKNDLQFSEVDCFKRARRQTDLVMMQRDYAFLKKMRQHLIHRGMLPLSYQIKNNGTCLIKFDKDKLLQYNSWNSKDKITIDELDKNQNTLQCIFTNHYISMTQIWFPAFLLLLDDADKQNKAIRIFKSNSLSLTRNHSIEEIKRITLPMLQRIRGKLETEFYDSFNKSAQSVKTRIFFEEGDYAGHLILRVEENN